MGRGRTTRHETAVSAAEHEMAVKGVIELDHDDTQGGEPEQLDLHEDPDPVVVHEHADAHERKGPQDGGRESHGEENQKREEDEDGQETQEQVALVYPFPEPKQIGGG